MQDINGCWIVLSELIGTNDSAMKFAPRTARHLAQQYPGFSFFAYGDPRGADGNQSDETTAYGIFDAHGIRVFPATNDNNPQMRRSTVESVLDRRNGLLINPSCLTLRTGMAGGYHYRKMKGHAGTYAPPPPKNIYSHIVESMENGLLGGGEGDAVVRSAARSPLEPSLIYRHRPRMRQDDNVVHQFSPRRCSERHSQRS